eukprot:gnl/Hemi2/3750_TR1307_c0_g2_i1.p1 gnl/Hemi2/3750_TR1307_c0_g2~~gnl/Hemi2/3750_TR1307_c0_g2_i1.p1  ORF type:complete len:448 (+),score=72.80 gnl/Hemi2/3750_TR1307_c0_g2_i1:278-1621(+)
MSSEASPVSQQAGKRGRQGGDGKKAQKKERKRVEQQAARVQQAAEAVGQPLFPTVAMATAGVDAGTAEGAAAVKPVVIDGSTMEGGGQVLRSTVAYASLLHKSLHIVNIRAGRANPGLQAQHLTGIELVAKLCGGRLYGNRLRSMEIQFVPGPLEGGDFVADTGSAGSCMLLFQIALPCIIFAARPCHLTLMGGTNAKMAPQVDAVNLVLTQYLQKFGVEFSLNCERRGYYPRGGGIVHVHSKPHTKIRAASFLDRGTIVSITGVSYVAGSVAFNVAERMAAAALLALKSHHGLRGVPINIATQHDTTALGSGCGIFLVAETSTGCRLEGSCLGERGVPSETVGSTAATLLAQQIDEGGCVDQFVQDQLLIFMALAEGTSRVRTGPLTLHTQTGIHFAQMLTGVRFTVTPDVGAASVVIECTGLGFTNQNLLAAVETAPVMPAAGGT